jgi:hypothetical protein
VGLGATQGAARSAPEGAVHPSRFGLARGANGRDGAGSCPGTAGVSADAAPCGRNHGVSGPIDASLGSVLPGIIPQASRTRRPSASVDDAAFTNSRRQTGRSPAPANRRRPHVERVARTSSTLARRVAVSRRSNRRAASPMPASPAGSNEAVASRPSLGVTDTIADTRPPGRVSLAMPSATRASAPSTPRSSEPHGNRIRTS